MARLAHNPQKKVLWYLYRAQVHKKTAFNQRLGTSIKCYR